MTRKINVTVPEIDKQVLIITLIGDSRLVVNRNDVKLLEDNRKPKPTNKPPKLQPVDPKKEMERKLYRLNGGYGFKAIGFKQCAVTAANDANMMKTMTRRAFHVVGEPNDEGVDLVKIIGKPKCRKDVVVNPNTHGASVAYRPEFWPWRVEVKIIYNAGIITPAQIINLYELAGFGVGVGEWRPEKDGDWGMFHVAKGEEK